MIADKLCPTDADLRLLLLGLPGVPVDTEHHFAACSRCAARAAQIRHDDSFVETARAAGMGTIVHVPITILDCLRGLTPPPRPADELRSGERVGAYRVERCLGRGGMGVVYLARHDHLTRPVALKVLPATAANERITRFHREAEVIATLRHPHIVQVFEVGESGGRAYYAMEYVPGGPLSLRLRSGPLPPTEAAQLAEAIARAVAAGHDSGVLHRDLKPANVLLDPPAGPKVVDFGLAKLLSTDPDSERLTEDGTVLGTPNYMAPEQAYGSLDLGPTVDVYGVGAILYECLTGRPPFAGSSPLQTLELVRTQEPVPPSRLQPAVPRDLQTICLKCLDKDPRRRYPSAAELAADLGRFLRGEPVVARPVGIVIRTAKWARRRPTAAAMLTACCLSIAALAIVITVYTARLRDEVNRTNASMAEATHQRQRAVTSYRAARGTIRRILARFDAHGSVAIPRLRELRREQFADALAFYETVLTGLDDPDPEIRLDAAYALVELAQTRATLNQPEAATADFRRAAGELERLPPEFQSRPDCRRALLTCLNHLAHAAGTGPDAEALWLRALAVAESLGDAEVLATAEHNLAGHYLARREFEQAESHRLRAIAIRAPLVARPEAIPLHRAAQAESLQDLGLTYALWNRVPQAVDAYQRAETLLDPLVRQFPNTDRYELALAAVCLNWGNLLRASGDLPGAFVKLNRAVELADAVFAREPLLAQARSRVLEAHGARAVALTGVRRYAEAVPDWDRVVATTAGPAQLHYRVDRALVLAWAGQWARAEAEADELHRQQLAAGDRYNLACVHALLAAHPDMAFGLLFAAADAERHAVAAVSLLRGLHTTEYFTTPVRASRLKHDLNLAGIARRPDFRQLLDDVASTQK